MNAIVPEKDDYSAEYAHVGSMLRRSMPFEALRRTINASISNPTLTDVDERILRLCSAYLVGTAEERDRYRSEVRNGWSLLHFCDRMATRALRTGDNKPIEVAAAALSVENKQSDARETIGDLAVLRYVTAKIGVDWNRMIQRLEAISSPDMIILLQEFAKRAPESLKLELFFRAEAIDANGPLIEYQSPNWTGKN
jgi:hypothetical protein